jgi:small subunit ribosomal protein S16
LVRIRLTRQGSKKRPYYRVVVQDSRKPRDGATIEEVGYYHPIDVEGKQISLNTDRINYWVGVGAQPSETVKKLLKKEKLSLN